MLLADANGWISAAFLVFVALLVGILMYIEKLRDINRSEHMARIKAEAERDTSKATDKELDSLGHESGAFSPGIDSSPLRSNGGDGDGNSGGSH